MSIAPVVPEKQLTFATVAFDRIVGQSLIKRAILLLGTPLIESKSPAVIILPSGCKEIVLTDPVLNPSPGLKTKSRAPDEFILKMRFLPGPPALGVSNAPPTTILPVF